VSRPTTEEIYSYRASVDRRVEELIATLEELAEAAGVACCPSAVHRALVRLGITRKKSPGGRPSRTGRN